MNRRPYDARTSLPSRSPARGFTLVELLVVTAIIMILAGMILSALVTARDAARLSYCQNNLRQIGQALILYENEERALPLGDLPETLRPYDGNRTLYRCPVDDSGAEDSYSPFYVCRAQQDTRLYLDGCFRHAGGERGPVLYGMAAVKSHPVEPVFANAGKRVVFGEELTGKTAEFADGSTAKVTGAGAMIVLNSFREDGRLYSLVKIKRNHHCAVDATVTPGSAFEVISPAAIAAALGTKYKVTTSSDPEDFVTDLQVTEGEVRFRARLPKARGRGVPAGESRQQKIKKAKAPKD